MSDPVVDSQGSQDLPALQAELGRLKKMVKALMDRSERAMSAQASEFGLFQATVMLETQVQKRTEELEAALAENEKITRVLEREKDEQRILIGKLEEAHNQLLQSEKLASIGQLAAGVAHEINNPIGFVNSNLGTLKSYVGSFLELIDAYEKNQSLASVSVQEEIAQLRQKCDFDFLREDIQVLINESIDGTARVRRIVQDLRDFSRTGSSEWQWTDLHQGLDSTLNMLGNELRHKATVKRQYGQLPPVECIPSQINQVFMNLIINALQAIVERGEITLASGCDAQEAWISISDTGKGIDPENLAKIFDPFFTTKPVGMGTGLGLSVSYGIIKNHGGRIGVESELGKGTCFTVVLPIRRFVPQDAGTVAGN